MHTTPSGIHEEKPCTQSRFQCSDFANPVSRDWQVRCGIFRVLPKAWKRIDSLTCFSQVKNASDRPVPSESLQRSRFIMLNKYIFYHARTHARTHTRAHTHTHNEPHLWSLITTLCVCIYIYIQHFVLLCYNSLNSYFCVLHQMTCILITDLDFQWATGSTVTSTTRAMQVKLLERSCYKH